MDLTLAPNAEISPALQITALDFSVMHGKLRVGRICRREGALKPDSQWIWAITAVLNGPDAMRHAGMAATIEEAQGMVQENWDQWLAWASLSDAGAV